MRTLSVLLLCLPLIVDMRMAPALNPSDVVPEADPLNPNHVTSNRPNAVVNPQSKPVKQIVPSPRMQQRPSPPSQPSNGPQNPRPQQQDLRRQLNRPQTNGPQVTQPMPQVQGQMQPPPQQPQQPQQPQPQPQQPQPQPQLLPQPQPAVPMQGQRGGQMEMPALVMLMPDPRTMRLLLPQTPASAMVSQPQLIPLTGGRTIPTDSKDGAKSSDLTAGFNPWTMGIEQLEALVQQFRQVGSVVLPNGQTIHKVNAGQTPTGVTVVNPAVGPQPMSPSTGPPVTGPQVPVSGPPPPQPPQPSAGPEAGPTATNEVGTDESLKPPAPEAQVPVNGTIVSMDTNRRRSLQHNALDHEHNTIETRFSQSPAKVNVGAVCDAVAATREPVCVSDHKWEEIMRQEIDCGSSRRREWRCYCGFFENNQNTP